MKKNNFLSIAGLAIFLLLPPALAQAAMSQEGNIRETTPIDPRALWHYANALYTQHGGDTDKAIVEFLKASSFDTKSAIIHDRLAYIYYVEGMDYKSEEELQKSIELAPNNIDTRLLLANLYASQGEFGKGQKEYQKILEVDPKNLSARYYLAGVLANQNRIEEALQKYQEILKDNPNEAAVYYNMGLIYTRANQVTKAEDTFKKAITLDPGMESAYTSLGLVYELDQKPQEAIATYESLVKVNPDNDRALLALGELFYNQKDDAKALGFFTRYSAHKPDDLSVYDYIGLCHFRLKQYDQAIEAFQKLLVKPLPQPLQPGEKEGAQKTGTNALVRYRLAAAYGEIQDYAKAEEQLRAILKDDEKSVDAWVRLALLYDKEKNQAAAGKAIEDGLKANPDHPDLILMEAMVYHEKNDFKQAEASYRKAIDIELNFKNKRSADYNVGSLAQAYFNLGALLDKQGRFNEAMEQMKKVVQLQPDNADAYNYIGYSYADKGINLDEAKKDVETALKLEPENSYYLDSLGWVYYQKAQYKDAREQFEKALKFLKTSVKDDAVIYEHLAEVLVKMGLKDEAVDKWEKASKLDPENKKYLEKIQKDKPSSSL